MNNALSLTTLARAAWRDFLRARRELVLCELIFTVVQAWLLVPAISLILASVLFAAGYVAVSNFDLLHFLLTPLGLLYAGLFSSLGLTGLLFEQACIMVLADLANANVRPPWWQLPMVCLGNFWRVTQLAATLVVHLALTYLPFLLLAWGLYYLLLSEQDLYFFLNVRPPVFWLAAGIGSTLVLLAGAITLWLYVRWALALPILLFENQSPRAALHSSSQRVRGAGGRVGLALLAVPLAMLLVGLATQALFHGLAAAVLKDAGDRPTLSILLLLTLQGGLLAVWSFVTVVGQTLLTRQLYLQRTPGYPHESTTHTTASRPIAPWNWRVAAGLIPMILLLPIGAWWELSRYATQRPPVGVTAHRGHSRAAPENTLSAVHAAIASGTDYVEIDVQLTADGQVVLLHDRDLKRVAGDPRRIADIPWADAKELDVGTWFNPKFASERIPTLAAVLELCRGRMKVNIELKFYDHDRRLVNEVLRVVQAHHFEPECLITSMNYDALQQVRRLAPHQRTGLIVAQAIGNLNRLSIDALMVRADFLTTAVIRAAHQRGQEIHVWTVNDPRQMAAQIKRGVDNLITSNPDIALQVRNEWAKLSESERILLASRLLLGLQP